MRAIALAAMLLLANAAMAADSGAYIGASLGISDTPAQCLNDLTGKRTCEGNVMAARGFLGYSLNDRLAIEAALLGVAASSDANAGALDLSALTSMPLSDRVALFGRLGVVGDSNRGDVTYGVGLRFDLESKASLRLEWQHFGSDSGIDFLFLGILSRF